MSVSFCFPAPSFSLAPWSSAAARTESVPQMRFARDAVAGPGGRTLVFAPSADAVHAQLLRHARQNFLPYLRVTLREQADLDRLMTSVTIRDGKIEAVEGPLFNLIRGGGVLLIDETGSNPKLLEGFNSLFDKNPYFAGAPASPALSVVTVMNEENFAEHPVSVYSRYLRVLEAPAIPFDDPVERLGPPPADLDAVVVDLWESPDVAAAILGSPFLSPIGIPRFEEGKLAEAARLGKPLVLRGGDWSERKEKGRRAGGLKDFARRLLVEGEIEVNGERIKVPPVYREERDFKQGIEGKSVILPSESKFKEPAWVVNEETQDLLFTRTKVMGKRLTQQRGILPLRPEERRRLRVTAPLPLWVWHRMLHAPGEIEILVENPAWVPEIYRSLSSAKLKAATEPRKPSTWAELQGKKGIYLEGEDLDWLRAELQRRLGDADPVVYPVTPQTTLADLLESIRIFADADPQTGDRGRGFALEAKGILRALQEGKRVILEGLERNPALRKELEPLFTEDPYLILNGERVSLAGLPGQVIGTSRPLPAGEPRPEHFAAVPLDDAALFEALRRDHPSLTEEAFQKILSLREAFRTVPSPGATRRTPERVPFGFSRIQMLLAFDNRIEGVDNVFVELYRENPEAAAFMRVMARLIFDVEEEGRLPNSLHAARVRRALNKTPPPVSMESHFWEFADSLSVDLLKKTVKENRFDWRDKRGVLQTVEEGLIGGNKGEKRRFYLAKFGRSAVPKGGPRLDVKTNAGEETLEQREARCARLLEKFRAVMFKGSPGTGKSRLAQQLPAAMGYAPDEVFGPITTGEDVEEASVLARRVIDADGATALFEEAAARWSGKGDGAVLIVDESNLPPAVFWAFLEGMFAPEPFVWVNGEKRRLTARHRVIFTGNQESLAGRKFQELVEKYVPTVNFPEFDEAFLLRLTRDEYLDPAKERREELARLMVELHLLFAKMGPQKGFSLRDLQELALRVNLMPEKDWTSDAVAATAWKQYHGLFDPVEQAALEQLLHKKTGAAARRSVEKEVAALRQKRQAEFRRKGIALVPSAAEMVLSIEEFLDARQARLEGKTKLQGKQGMIFEGPSGRGKDDLLLQTLRARGFVDAATAIAGVPPARRYYRLTASVSYEQMERTIRRAREEGSVVILSEMNLLPSAILEGKLNDVLTGAAAEGFALFGTLNSVDFQGREKLSTALQNRVVYRQVREYGVPELLEIALEALGPEARRDEATARDARLLVQLHAWIAEKAGETKNRPTPREILKAMALLRRGEPRERIVQEVYGPIFLKRILRGARPPSDEELARYEPKKEPDFNRRVLERIATFLVPEKGRPVTLQMDAVTKQGGYYTEADNSITLSTKSPFEYNLGTVDHESGHALFTRTFAGLTPAGGDEFWYLYMWLEDRRQERGMKRLYPFAAVEDPQVNDEGFVAAVESLDADYLLAMKPRDLFMYLLSSYALGWIGEEQVRGVGELMKGVYEPNPAALAVKYLETARRIVHFVPDKLDEEEVQFAQWRALVLLQEMREEFLSIHESPDTGEKPPDEEAQQAAIERAKDQLEEGSLDVKERPAAAPSAGPAAAKRGLTAEEIAAKKAAIEAKKAQIRAMKREDVEKELRFMEEDLAERVDPVSIERLDEMAAQLSDPKHPYSLVAKLADLKEAGLTARAKGIQRRIPLKKREIADREREYRLAEGQGRKTFYEKMQQALQDGDLSVFMPQGRRGLSLGSPRGLRYPVARTHDRAREQPFKPVALAPEEPRPLLRPLSQTETAARNATLASVSAQESSALDGALRGFFAGRIDFERQYGLTGRLDVPRYVRGDVQTAFVKSGGRETLDPKEIVLIPPTAGTDSWNPVMEELFFYLFQKGFTVTVYGYDRSDPLSNIGLIDHPAVYVEGINTVGDLREVMFRELNGAEPGDLSPHVHAKKDLQKRKRQGAYEIVGWHELQAKVEAAYGYGLARQALAAGLPVAVAAPKTAPTPLTIAERYDHGGPLKRTKLNRLTAAVAVLDEEGNSFEFMISNDIGTKLLLATENGMIVYYDVEADQYEPISGVERMTGIIKTIISTPDLSRTVVVTSAREALTFHLADRGVVQLPMKVRAAVSTPDGKWLLVFDGEKLHLFDPETRQLFSSEEITLYLDTPLAIHPSGKYAVATGITVDGKERGVVKIELFDSNGQFSPRITEKLADLDGDARAIAFTADGSKLVVSLKDKQINSELWVDLATQQVTPFGHARMQVSANKLTADGSVTLASRGGSGSSIFTPKGIFDVDPSFSSTIAISPDGRRIFGITESGEALMYEAPPSAALAASVIPAAETMPLLPGATGTTAAATVKPNYDLFKGRKLPAISRAMRYFFPDGVPEGGRVISDASGNRWFFSFAAHRLMYDVSQGIIDETEMPFEATRESPICVASADAKTVIFSTQDGRVISSIFNDQGKRIQETPLLARPSGDGFIPVSVSADGKIGVANADGNLQFFDPEKPYSSQGVGEKLIPGTPVAMHPSGLYVYAFVQGKTPDVWMMTQFTVSKSERDPWRIERKEEVRAIPAESLTHMAFSRDGNRLFLRTRNGEFNVWDVADKKTEGRIPLGSYAAARTELGTSDGSAFVDFGRGMSVLQLKESGFETLDIADRPIAAAAISGDGRRILAVQQDGSAMLYEEPEKTLPETEAITAENLDSLSSESLLLEFSADNLSSNVTVSDDGRFVAYGTLNGEVTVQDVETGSSRSQKGLPPVRFVSFLKAADGKELLIVVGRDDSTAALDPLTMNIMPDVMAHLVTRDEESFLVTLGEMGALPSEVQTIMFTKERLTRGLEARSKGMKLEVFGNHGRSLSFKAHRGKVHSVAAGGRRGKFIATNSLEDGTVRLWGIPVHKTAKAVSDWASAVAALPPRQEPSEALKLLAQLLTRLERGRDTLAEIRGRFDREGRGADFDRLMDHLVATEPDQRIPVLITQQREAIGKIGRQPQSGAPAAPPAVPRPALVLPPPAPAAVDVSL